MKNLLISTLTILLIVGCNNQNKEGEEKVNKIEPQVMHGVEPINSFTPLHVANLTQIVIGLEKYKQEKKMYPVSVNYPNEWEVIYDSNGAKDWFKNLSSEYIDVIKVSIKLKEKQRYLYKSDGAHYKIIFTNPDDCKEVKNKSPQLIDFKRGCKAYGFWTPKAIKW